MRIFSPTEQMDVSVDRGDLQTEKDLWTAALVILLTTSDPPIAAVRDRGDAEIIGAWHDQNRKKRTKPKTKTKTKPKPKINNSYNT